MNHWQSLSAYVPFDRQAAMFSGNSLPTSATGTVIFADIAGYTRLSRLFTERLGADRGADALAQQLNKFDTALIGELHRFKGSVLSFSGDAITCWLEGDSGERAIVVALNMQKALDKIKRVEVAPGYSAEVGLKVAVTYGTVRRFLVGDPNIQYVDAIAGNVLDRVAAAEQLITSGEIIIGEQVQNHLKGRVEIADYRTDVSGERFAIVTSSTVQLVDDPWPNFVYESAALLERWVLPPIVTYLTSEARDFLTELRDSSALFLSFSGIDYDNDPAAGEKLDRFIRRVQEILARYEAYLLQLTIGEKGSYFLASFGSPLAHEDDSSRAVSAALEIVSFIKRLDSIAGVRIGINQGVIRAGAYGSPNRKTYGIQGSAINFAARLMQQAQDNQIIVSESVVTQSPLFKFAPHSLKKFKGFDSEVQTYEVIGKNDAFAPHFPNQENQTEVFGRQQELDAINQKLSFSNQFDSNNREAASGASIIIEGDAGMGKSVLIRTVLSQMAQQGVNFWVGAADAVEQSTPYYAWRPILETILNINEEMSFEEIETSSNDVLSDSEFLLSRLPLLSDILPVSWPENQLTSSLSGNVRADNIRDFIFGVLELIIVKVERAGEQSILVIEDAHWLDSRSARLLSRMRRTIPSLNLIVLTRPIWDETGDIETFSFLNSLKREPDSLHLRLERLASSIIDAIIAQKLDVLAIPNAVKELIHAHAEGNPFYSEEIAYALRDLGLIKVENKQLVLPRGEAFGNLRFPNTIQGVITSRIDRLSPPEQLTAKAASVIGRSFELETLTNIHPAAPQEQIVVSQMTNMTNLDITLVEHPSPDLTYMFKHSITRDVIYSLLPFEQRRSLHRRVAERIEGSDVDTTQFAPLLVHHWKKAEINSKIRDYLLLAGQQATHSGSFREAEKALSELLEMVDDGRITDVEALEKAEWEWLLGQAKYGLGKLVEARVLFERAVSVLDQPVPQSTFRLGGSILRNAAVQVAHRRNPDRYFNIANEGERHRYKIAMQIYRSLNDIYFYMEEKIALLYVGVRQINIAENVGHSLWLPQANAVMGVITSLFGMEKLSDAYFKRAMTAADKVEDPTALATVLLGNSLAKVGKGDFDTVVANSEQGLAIFEQFGRQKDWGDTVSTLAFSQFYQGQHIKANQSWSKLLDSAFQSEHTIHEIWAYTWLGAIAYRDGDYKGAAHILSNIAPLFKRAQDKVSEISFHGVRGLTHYKLGEDQEAAEEIYMAQALIESTNGQPSGYFSREGYTAVCEFALSQFERGQHGPDAKKLKKNAQQALKAMKTFCRFFAIGKPALDFYQGWFLEIQGNQSKSIETYFEAMDQALELNFTFEIIQISERLDSLLPTGDSRREDVQTHFKRARQTLSAI